MLKSLHIKGTSIRVIYLDDQKQFGSLNAKIKQSLSRSALASALSVAVNENNKVFDHGIKKQYFSFRNL